MSKQDLDATKRMRVELIKRALPFSHLLAEDLAWLADKVEVMQVKSKQVIFHQGDIGDACYFICSGQIEILLVGTEASKQKSLALLKTPAIFGEATLFNRSVRNATARAVENSTLLVLNYCHLKRLMLKDKVVTQSLLHLMLNRSRPLSNRAVLVHKAFSQDKKPVIMLKNTTNHRYFELSEEGYFIWTLLDGKNTLQDITLLVADKFNLFAPEQIASLINRLAEDGFILNVKSTLKEGKRFWLGHLFQKQMIFTKIDRFLTFLYQSIVRYFFTKVGEALLAAIAFGGFIYFVANTRDVLFFFSIEHESLYLLLGLLPLALLELVLHELGHGFAVKFYGKVVHYIGIGLRGLKPVVFIDTSDMWLADKKARIVVTLAGLYVDVIVAGLSSFSVGLINNPFIDGMFWLFALYTYINAFRRLSPLQQRDGYYLLMDFLDTKQLRQQAFFWLLNDVPQAFNKPKPFYQNWHAFIYWGACILFIILLSAVAFMLQGFALAVLGIVYAHHGTNYIIPLFVATTAVFSMIMEVRQYQKRD